MYWVHNQYSHSPQIDSILGKEDLTLNELFEQDNLFQELKSPNKALVDFITRNDILFELVRLVTEEPSPELDVKERYRLSNLACEVLTTDTPVINQKLSNKQYLEKLYSFLEQEPPLNPLLASFFGRTLGMLICRKHDQNWYSYSYTCLHVLDFLKSQTKSLHLLIKHMGTSAIMEVTLKLLTQIEGPDLQSTLINLLEHESMIDNLISLFNPTVDEDKHYNVSLLLVDTIHKVKENLNNSGENGGKRRDSDPILDMIQSPAMVDNLLSNVFGDEVSESSIIGGIEVLLALLCPPPNNNMNRRDFNDEMGSSGDQSFNRTNILPILHAIVPYIPRLHDLLINPPKREAIKLACGTVDPPLGQARLSIVKFLSTLISTNTPEINAKLDEINTIKVLLDLFFHYTWNNFLHTQVEKCLAFNFKTHFEMPQGNPLVPNIFLKCKILQRILEAVCENGSEEKKGNPRRGYMGHLINIANNLAMQCHEQPLAEFLKDNIDLEVMEMWENFVSETLLLINNLQNMCLGGVHPLVKEISDDEIKMTKLQGGEYSHVGEDVRQFQELQAIIENYHLGLQEDDNSDHSASLFSQICSNKSSSDWLDVPKSHDSPTNSSDEEEEDDETEVWSSCNSGGIIVDGDNPWGDSAPSEPEQGWANFDTNIVQSYAQVVQNTPPHSQQMPAHLSDTPLQMPAHLSDTPLQMPAHLSDPPLQMPAPSVISPVPNSSVLDPPSEEIPTLDPPQKQPAVVTEAPIGEAPLPSMEPPVQPDLKTLSNSVEDTPIEQSANTSSTSPPDSWDQCDLDESPPQLFEVPISSSDEGTLDNPPQETSSTSPDGGDSSDKKSEDPV